MNVEESFNVLLEPSKTVFTNKPASLLHLRYVVILFKTKIVYNFIISVLNLFKFYFFILVADDGHILTETGAIEDVNYDKYWILDIKIHIYKNPYLG